MLPPENYAEFVDRLHRALLENEGCPVLLLIESRNKGLFIGSNIANASLQFGIMDAAKIVVGMYYQKSVEESMKCQDGFLAMEVPDKTKVN